ncbi:MAG: family 10 glycosylhydrolase [Gemmatimonadaceae bacterium]|nr:family 10 glycosylhydrolase [Gemmatimonadaceae bacterium]
MIVDPPPSVPTTATAPPRPDERAADAPRAAERLSRRVPARPAVSETAPDVAREFRGVWVATVANIDWPSKRTLSTAAQQRELLDLLDRAASLKLNAVIFQVRPAADALYASTIEPWSEYLTGTQGRAPEPFWDPLSFVIREAHARNLELHAWFNPYRARHTDARSPLASNHLARTNPALVKKYAGYLWMDPGEKAVRERTLRVVLDVVKRYDIDGVHIDDYFYPYPENTRRGREIPFPDDGSWRKYRKGGGTLDRGDWRRRNVDMLVEALHDGIHTVKPWVRFGVSPFGIWRPGYPAQVRGFDAFGKLYADGRKWLNEGWVDYFTPQLYWPTTRVAQSYPALLQWWAEENTQSRHLWPGNFTSRAGASGASAFSVGELVEQIRVTRLQPGATGNVHFSMKSFLLNQGSMNDSLAAGPYADIALTPATPWLPTAAPPTPALRLTNRNGTPALVLGTIGPAAPWQWLVQYRTPEGWTTTVLPGDATSVPLPVSGTPDRATVRAFNRVGVESPPVSISLSDTASGLNVSGRAAQPAASRSSSRGRPDGR